MVLRKVSPLHFGAFLSAFTVILVFVQDNEETGLWPLRPRRLCYRYDLTSLFHEIHFRLAAVFEQLSTYSKLVISHPAQGYRQNAHHNP